MKHLYLIVALVRGAATAPGERFFGALCEGLYLVRVHLEALCEFGQRTVAATAARATFALNEGLWVLRVRLAMGLVGLIVSEQGRNTTP